MQNEWMWLSIKTALSAQSLFRAVALFGSPKAVYEASATELRDIEGLRPQEHAALCDKDMKETEQILLQCYNRGIQLLCYDDTLFPERLRQIPDPPAVLYYLGTMPEFDRELTVAVVGSRKASFQGLQVARKFGYDLASGGALVVSGCASGIDASAMEGALRGGNRTIGVLGNGADIVYPRENKRLFESVRDYGCLISEYRPGTRPERWNFPRRNRIISGLSLGVLVVEAPEKSGSLITARCALEQGRDVFAVPGNIDMETYAGSNQLLRDGAILVTHGQQILDEYDFLFPDRLRNQVGKPDPSFSDKSEQDTGEKSGNDTQSNHLPDKKVVDNPMDRNYIDVHKCLESLTEEERAVLLCVGKNPISIDDVIAASGLAAGQALSALTMLELEGCVERPSGDTVVLAK